MPFRKSVLIAVLGVLALTVGGTPVAADPGSPQPKNENQKDDGDDSRELTDLQSARAEVRDRSRELDQAQVRLAVAEARLQDLAARAERLIEAYNGELVRLRDAKSRHETITANLTRAGAQLEESRRQVAVMAAESYGRLDISEPMVAVIGEGASFLRRASLLSQLSDHQAATMKKLRDSQQVHAILQVQAARTLEEQRQAAAEAERLKKAAAEAVEEQMAETRSLKQEREDLAEQLDAARSRVEILKRAKEVTRLENLRLAKSAYPAGASESTKVPEWAKAATETSEAASRGTGGAAARTTAQAGAIAARWALGQLGKPYEWAADGPASYDCSGLTMRAWERAGVELDHWTGTQWSAGTRVPLDELRPGDLLFFGRISADPGTIHHVGIFIGRGQMVHAPQTGDVIRIASMWRRDLVGAIRPA